MSAQTPETAAPAQAPTPWHTLSVEEVTQRLEIDPAQGLESAAARDRLERYGPNSLPEKPPRSLVATFIDQFKSLLILILALAAVVAWAIGDLKDAIVIMVVTMLNALLGFSQEFRAERSLIALRHMLALEARVRRDGTVQEIHAEELVPGDVIVLEAGARIPADARLLVAESLEVDESTLTGESHAVAKQAATTLPEEAQLGERINLLFMNTMITRGRAEAVVTATGAHTEMGQLAMALTEAEEPPTPLQVQLDGLGKRLSLVAGVFVVAILGLSLWAGRAWHEALLEAVALAVAAVPEGLPAVVTVTLAIGMQRMARNRAIVKRLAAVETLGCTTVICSDKTGTLTMNQMTARAFNFQGRRYSVSGEGYRANGAIRPEGGGDDDSNPNFLPLLRPLALCNDSQVKDGAVIGDPMEGALIVLAEKGGVDVEALRNELPRIAEVPFDAEHKLMATFHREGDTVLLQMKGAPEAVLARCSQALEDGGTVPLDDARREAVSGENTTLADRQLRVLAVAARELPADGFDPQADLWPHLEELTLTGLVGLIDPPRPEVKVAIANCNQAGIDVKMITGDQPGTAKAIARELGLGAEAMTGAELDRLSPEEAAERIPDIHVFARVTPAHKTAIVRALQAKGHVVAMTGDGVNDAPALKGAHIGVAMGQSGTEVAKEAATTVLTDDNFATIVGAVREGRTIYANIVKFVRFQLSTNIGALFSMLFANLLGLPAPLNTIQILWVNIIMDGPPAMAMGLDPARREIMQDPPRPTNAEILSWQRLGTLLVFGSIMVIGTLGMLTYGLATGSEQRALTLSFTTFVLFQVWNAFNARVERGTAFNRLFFSNWPLWVALAGVVSLQIVAVQWPAAELIFRTAPLSLTDWLLCTAVASSIILYGEIHRWIGHVLHTAFPGVVRERRKRRRPAAPAPEAEPGG